MGKPGDNFDCIVEECPVGVATRSNEPGEQEKGGGNGYFSLGIGRRSDSAGSVCVSCIADGFHDSHEAGREMSKTKDDATVTVPVRVQYYVLPGKVKEAYYELDDPED